MLAQDVARLEVSEVVVEGLTIRREELGFGHSLVGQ